MSEIRTNEQGASLTGIGQESMSLIETCQESMSDIETCQESMSRIETGQESMSLTETGQESMSLIETGQESMSHIETCQESMSHIETCQESMSLIETGQESMSLIETGQVSMSLTETGQERMSLIETGQERMSHIETGQESMSLIETDQESMNLTDTGQERMNLIETYQKSMSLIETGQESMSLTETSQESMSLIETGQESMSLIETGQECMNLTDTSQESMSLTQRVQETVSVHQQSVSVNELDFPYITPTDCHESNVKAVDEQIDINEREYQSTDLLVLSGNAHRAINSMSEMPLDPGGHPPLTSTVSNIRPHFKETDTIRRWQRGDGFKTSNQNSAHTGDCTDDDKGWKDPGQSQSRNELSFMHRDVNDSRFPSRSSIGKPQRIDEKNWRESESRDDVYVDGPKSWRDNGHIKTTAEFPFMRRNTGFRDKSCSSGEKSWRDPDHRKSGGEFPFMERNGKNRVPDKYGKSGKLIEWNSREDKESLELNVLHQISETDIGQQSEVELIRSNCKLKDFSEKVIKTKDENIYPFSSHKTIENIRFPTLKTWSENEDYEDVLLQIFNKVESVDRLLMSSIVEEEWYTCLVQALVAIVRCQTHPVELKRVLQVISASHFLTHLLSNYLDLKQDQGMAWTGAEQFYKSMLTIVEHIAKIAPESVHNCKPALKCLRGMISCIESVSGKQAVEDLIVSVLSIVTKAQKMISERPTEKATNRPHSDNDSPPEDFRELSVIPTPVDLSVYTKPFVRAVVTKGAFRDQEHYLDVHFRLMREDFIKPLRRGLQEYRERGHEKKFKSSDIRVYRDVRFIAMTTDKGIHHVIQFDVSEMNHVKWEHSKLLLNGNLLIFSNDNFKSNLIFATVHFRDPELLRRGIITVDCISGLRALLKSSSGVFVMAETTAFYEAVNPILKGLQRIRSNMPLKEYIISCQKELKSPSYLKQDFCKYNIECLMKTRIMTDVNVLDPFSWPSAEKMCLNSAQRDAAILALTKEIAVIQGPPGTGKTHVGLKVMQVLLENRGRVLENEINGHDPILVICYTNHALDQFLEGILKFCPSGIVRVGGNKSSDALRQFHLSELARNRNENKLDLDISYGLLNLSHIHINHWKNILDSLTNDIIEEDALCQYMHPNHFDSLQTGPHQADIKSKVHQWLHVSDKSMFQYTREMIKYHMTKLVMKCLHLTKRKAKSLRIFSLQPIVERVQIYGNWLSKYQQYLRKGLKASDVEGHLDKDYFSALYDQSCRPSILNDSEIRQVIPPDCYDVIRRAFGTNICMYEESDQLIGAWVLGLQYYSHNKQLDEYAKLKQFIQHLQRTVQNPEDDFDDEESKNALEQRGLWGKEEYDKKRRDEILSAMSQPACLLQRAMSLGMCKNFEEKQEDKCGVDSNEFQTTTHTHIDSFAKVIRYLSDDKNVTMCTKEEESILDVWKMEMKDRFALYKLWIERYKESIMRNMELAIDEYNDAKQLLQEIRMQEEISVLKQAKVIGMTTTGAAKKTELLKTVGCRIIIVEEAAEVLEAHIVAALNTNCRHLILIGDHKQLRPNPAVFEHAKHYGLDVSLFERLVNNDIPHVTLSEQHRMRESISAIMRHIYPCLQDHVSVKEYKNIRGVSKNIFFIQHDKDETIMKDSLSKSNPFEAKYLIGLCKYFLLQGYKPSQITILATYGGQVLTLKKEMKDRNITNEIRVSTVDNFQGEESDIILLSLVRSNEQSVVGFLKVDNRVCVALSRAKKGMFAIGNLALLASQSKLWDKIRQTAEDEGITGDGLPISCPNHPYEKNVIRDHTNFSCCPEGGCCKKCDFRLNCGHVCPLICHGYDLQHTNVECFAPCKERCPMDHPCRKKCYEECGDCIVKVQKRIAECGHTNSFNCSKVPNETDCYSPCETVLLCGHRCKGKCGECKQNGCHKACQVPEIYSWPCGHIVEVPCYVQPDIYPCPKACDEILQCGHKCPGKCPDCLEGAVHMACTEKCGMILFCGHTCRGVCGAPCPPCSLPCPAMCRHGGCSRMNLACSEPCPPCKKPCENRCPHRKCTRLCHEKCDVQPCEQLCSKLVDNCGHPCAGLCGEMCVCRKCKRVSKCQTSAKGDSNASHSQKCKTKLLFRIPSCWHAFIMEDIDHHIACMDKKASTEFLLCPKCSVPIQKCYRFDHASKERHMRREEKKTAAVYKQYKLTDVEQVMIGKSLKLVQQSDLGQVSTDWKGLRLRNINSFGEVLTLTLKLKFAYVINVIMSLDHFETLVTKVLMQKRTSALLKIKKYFSPQQIKEYKLDLKSLLLFQYAGMLKTMAQNLGIDVSADTCMEVTQSLKGSKTDAIRRGIAIVNILEHSIVKECSESTTQATFLEKQKLVNIALDLLDAENEKMLCEVIVRSSFEHGPYTDPTKSSEMSKDNSFAAQHGGSWETTGFEGTDKIVRARYGWSLEDKESTDGMEGELTDKVEDELTDKVEDELTDKVEDELTDKMEDELTDKVEDNNISFV